ncbi:uncharacterized protein LOC111947510 isoform X2 [Oryzias latipes]
MVNKDGLIRYSSAYPDFVEAVRFHQAFEEARVRSLQPGQEGQALVGFGDFKFETLQSLYESQDPKKIRFVNYLRRKAPAPGTQMEYAVRFIKARDRQRAALHLFHQAWQPNLHRDLHPLSLVGVLCLWWKCRGK